MTPREFSATLELLIPMLVDSIMAGEGLSMADALTVLYTSHLYEKLEDERTKLWHLSVPTLHALLRQERETGHIDWPEEA